MKVILLVVLVTLLATSQAKKTNLLDAVTSLLE